MKTNNKILKLINHGLSGDLLSELDERQINSLYTRLVEKKEENDEAVTTKSSIESTKYTGPEVAAMKSKGQGLKVNGEVLPTADGGLEVIKRTGTAGSETTESEMKEDSDVDLALALQSQEMNEKFESKAQQKYFWAKCGRSKGKEKEKWCKMAEEFSKKTSKKDYKKMPEKINPEKTVKVKKEQKENYMNMIGNAFNKNMQNKLADIRPSLKWESELEKRIDSIIEENLSPKMSKKDLVDLLSEIKKTKKMLNHKKTKDISEQSPTIAPPKPKTPTKPSKPDTPYTPKPGPKPGPKAQRDEMPNWLKFGRLGINLK